MAKKTILVFGNPLLKEDSAALAAARALRGKIKGVRFKEIESLLDLARIPKEIILLDAANGVKRPCVVPLEKIVRTKAVSGHDLDLSVELLLLKKMGKLKKVRIIALPQRLSEEALKCLEKIIST